MDPKEKWSELDRVLVFPLKESILFPKALVPLNIFEPRYIQMVNDSVHRQLPIALAWSQDGGMKPEQKSPLDRFKGRYSGIGSSRIVDRREDGAMIVLLEGVGKVRLGKVIEEDPYIVCEAEWVEESDELSPGLRFKLARIERELVAWADENIKDQGEGHRFKDSLTNPSISIQAGCLLLVDDISQQQKLLDLSSNDERLLSLLQILESA